VFYFPVFVAFVQKFGLWNETSIPTAVSLVALAFWRYATTLIGSGMQPLIWSFCEFVFVVCYLFYVHFQIVLSLCEAGLVWRKKEIDLGKFTLGVALVLSKLAVLSSSFLYSCLFFL
jgi:hypothetical protein